MSSTLLELIRNGESPMKFSDDDVIRTERWPVDDFIKLVPYIKNRPVEKRVKKKKAELSKGFLLTHLEVKVGRAIKDFENYRKGDLFVTDGNTRALTWLKYPELKPKMRLSVVIMDFTEQKNTQTTYYSIDSSTSYETSGDKIGGFFRSIKYEPISSVMKKGNIKTTIEDATKYIKFFGNIPRNESTVDDRLNYVLEELKFLDKFFDMVKPKILSSNLQVCMILIAKKYGMNNTRFLKMLDYIITSTYELNDSHYCDGVYYTTACLYVDNVDKWKVTGMKKSPELLSEMLFCLDQFMKGNPLKKRKDYKIDKVSKQHFELYQTYLD